MNFFRKIVGYRLALSPLQQSSVSRRQRLLNIIKHANSATTFYNSAVYTQFLMAERDLSDEEFFYAYSHLPVISQQYIQSKHNDFIANILKDKVKTLPPLTASFNKPKERFIAPISINGSADTPATRWLDYDDTNSFAQSFLKSFNLNGWKKGERFVVFTPFNSNSTEAYTKHAKALNHYFGLTIIAFEDITKDSVETLLTTLRERKATLLCITPTALHRVCEIMQQEGIEPFEQLKHISVSKEFFLECSKSFIQTMFPDSDIQSSYSAAICGNIAHQKSLHGADYNVFDDYVYLEQGSQNTILITHYRQKSFPLIRYQVRDTGRIINNEDGSQSILCLEGRSEDYIIASDSYPYYASFFDHFINQMNSAFHDPITHFSLRHCERYDEKYMHINFVLSKKEQMDKIRKATQETLGEMFAHYTYIDILFSDTLEYDHTQKFKIIEYDDKLGHIIKQYIQQKSRK